jgi:ankyrin repeat protein
MCYLPVFLERFLTHESHFFFLFMETDRSVNFVCLTDVLKELLQAFPALAMTTNSVNATALDTAATQGHIDIVNLLLETDASLARIARNNGKTVLHSAARMGHVEVVTSLLSKDPGVGFRTDKKGQTALHMASKGQNAEILLELLKPDVSVIHVEDSKGNRPLHVATRKGNTIVGDPISENLLFCASYSVFLFYAVSNLVHAML